MNSASSNEATAVPQITPAIVLAAPNGGEVWQAGVTRSVQWTSTGCTVPAHVTLSYSIDNGSNWTTIATVANTGSSEWIIPDISSGQALVRVSGGAVTDNSNGVFTILQLPVPGIAASQPVVNTAYCAGASGTTAVNIALSDPLYAVTTLTVSVVSSNPSIVPNSNIVQSSATGATTSFIVTSQATNSSVAVLTFTVSNGYASQSTSVTIQTTVSALPSAAITGSTSVCASAVQNYSVVSESGNAYHWTVTGGSITGGQGTGRISVQWGAAGAGSVQVVVTNATACTASKTIAVAVRAVPQPTILAGGSTSVCAGGSVVLTAQPSGMNYLWSNGATTQSISAIASGMYSVVVTNMYGCSAASTNVSVTVHPAMTVLVSGNTQICASSSAQLVGHASSAVGNLSFSWSPATGLNNPNIVNPIATPAATTMYTLTVTDGNGCSSTASIVVEVLQAPLTTISSNATLCAGGSVQLAATGGTSYSWSPATGLSNPNIANPIATPGATTTYTVTMSTNGTCTVRRSVTVTIAQPVVASAGSDVSVCKGGTIQLTATGGTSYSWSPATGLSNPNIANPVASPGTTTTYTVTVRNAGGCSSTASVTVTAKPLSMQMTVLLEGPYNGSSMNTYLHEQGVLPAQQPYNTTPYNYNGTETLEVADTAAVVDWVLVELRGGITATSLIERKAALLRSNGTIVDSKGEAFTFSSLMANQSYYVVVWHRNHLGAMTARPVNVNAGCAYVYNLSSSGSAVYSHFGSGQKQLGLGAYGLVAGDTGDGIINAIDRVAVRNATGLLGYLVEDCSLDGIVNATDRVFVQNNSFLTSQVP